MHTYYIIHILRSKLEERYSLIILFHMLNMLQSCIVRAFRYDINAAQVQSYCLMQDEIEVAGNNFR